jgi:hypothetical protein
MHYYRLMQTDLNGNYTYATIISINPCEGNVSDQFTISPNPTSGKFKLSYSGLTSDIRSVDILDSRGQYMYSTDSFQSNFDLSNHAPGLYILRINQNSKIINLKFILVNDSNN